MAKTFKLISLLLILLLLSFSKYSDETVFEGKVDSFARLSSLLTDGRTNTIYAEINVTINFNSSIYIHENVSHVYLWGSTGYEDLNAQDQLLFNVPSNTNLTLYQIGLTGCYHDLGGCIHMNNGSSLLLEYVYAYQNQGECGAVVYGEVNSTIQIIDSAFIDNNATFFNTSTYLNNYVFDDDSSLDSSKGCYGGGVLWAEASEVIVSTSVFEGNEAWADGGVFDLVNEASLSITASNFSINSAWEDGGVISIRDGSLVIGEDCLFEDNFGYTKGGVAYAKASDVLLNSSAFKTNLCLGKGGSFFLDDASMNVYNAIFYANDALEGGALYSDSSTTYSISQTVFELNTASDSYGGAIYAGTYGEATIEESFFYENNASCSGSYGGGGAFYAGTSFVLSLSSSHLYSNEGCYGGALSLIDTDSSTVTNSTFYDNLGHQKGDDLYMDNTEVTFFQTVHFPSAQISKTSGYTLYVASGDSKLILDDLQYTSNPYAWFAYVESLVDDTQPELIVRNALVNSSDVEGTSLSCLDYDEDVCVSNLYCTSLSSYGLEGVECRCYDGITDPNREACETLAQIELPSRSYTTVTKKPSESTTTILFTNIGDDTLYWNFSIVSNTEGLLFLDESGSYQSSGLLFEGSSDGCELEQIIVEMNTTDLQANAMYDATFLMHSTSNTEARIEINISFSVQADVSSSFSKVVFEDTNISLILNQQEVADEAYIVTSGESFYFTLLPYDVTNMALYDTGDELFNAYVSSNTTDLQRACDVYYVSLNESFLGECFIDTQEAGWFELRVEDIYSNPIIGVGDMNVNPSTLNNVSYPWFYLNESYQIYADCPSPFVKQGSACVCSEGYYFSTTDESCNACPIDTYKTTIGGTGVSSCLSCSSLIPYSITNEVGVSSEDGCICPTGRYMNVEDTECEEADDDFVKVYDAGTTIETLYLKKGIWRLNEESDDFRVCPVYKACVGRNDTDAYCSEGYEGILCNTCTQREYFKYIGGSCLSCSDTESIAIVLFPIVLFVVLVLSLAVIFRFIMRSLPNLSNFGRLDPQLMEELRYMKKDFSTLVESVKSFSSQLKVLVGLYQTVSNFGRVFSIPFPDSTTNIFAFFGMVNLNISYLLPWGCWMEMNWQRRFLLSSSWPLIVLLVCLFVYLNPSCIRFLTKKKGKPPKSRKTIRCTVQSFVNSFLFLLYPSLCMIVFSAFQCEQIETKWFLVEDREVDCESTEYYSFLIIPGIFMFLYVLGIPLFYYIQLSRKFGSPFSPSKNKVYTADEVFEEKKGFVGDSSSPFIDTKEDKLGESILTLPDDEEEMKKLEEIEKRLNRKAPSRLGIVPQESRLDEQALEIVKDPLLFLYENYKEEYYYFEVIESMRKFMMLGVMIFLGSGSLQITMGILVTSIFLAFYSFMRPYKDKNDNRIMILSLFVSLVVLLAGLLLKLDSNNTTQIAIILIIVLVLPFLLALFSFSVSFPLLFELRRKLATFKKKISQQEKQEEEKKYEHNLAQLAQMEAEIELLESRMN